MQEHVKASATAAGGAASEAPVRQVRLGPRDFTLTRRPDGTIDIASPHKLDPYPDKITERLIHWAHTAPDRTFLAQRDAQGEWRRLSFAQTLAAVRALGTALLTRDLSAERPVMILSGNDIEHALLGLAAMYIGVPYAPISPPYALISGDFNRLRHIFDLLTPGLVFAADGHLYHRAIEALVPKDMEVIVTRNAPDHRRVTAFADLLATAPTPAVDAAHARVGPDTIAKFLFTSGSTGMPKGVINTQHMWCSNQVMIRTQLAFFQDTPPVLVEWAPWHHTAGGNHDFGIALYNGGSIYLDDGKPLPGAIETTVKNLREIAPTFYFTVPKGYEALIPFFHADEVLRKNFFSRLQVLWFAGAALSQQVFDEMKALAIATCGERILFLTGLGSTETAPFALARVWESEKSTNMGLPPPGCDLKLVPMEGKLDARLRGPHITPGYWREPKLTANAFDEEGYYRLGDALKFEDENDPGKGLLFDGRLNEDFKLSSGTWVSVGPLRAQVIEHFAPYAKDVVIAGADRDEVGVLIFPDMAACKGLVEAEANAPASPFVPAQAGNQTEPELGPRFRGDERKEGTQARSPDERSDIRDSQAQAAPDLSPTALCAHPRVLEKFQSLLNSLAQKSTGGSNRVCRAMLLAEPPSLDKGEITDKGSINQRAVLSHRADAVAAMYAREPGAGVMVVVV